MLGRRLVYKCQGRILRAAEAQGVVRCLASTCILSPPLFSAPSRFRTCLPSSPKFSAQALAWELSRAHALPLFMLRALSPWSRCLPHRVSELTPGISRALSWGQHPASLGGELGEFFDAAGRWVLPFCKDLMAEGAQHSTILNSTSSSKSNLTFPLPVSHSLSKSSPGPPLYPTPIIPLLTAGGA